LGDFNTTRFLDEKLGGRSLTFAKLESFNKFIDDYILSDIKNLEIIGYGTIVHWVLKGFW